MMTRQRWIRVLAAMTLVVVAAVWWLRRPGGSGQAGGGASGDAVRTPVDDLAWLAGCWKQEEPNFRREEQWMRPDGGTLIGMSRTVAGGKTVEYESLRIEMREGRLVYVAAPSGQPEAVFYLEELTDSSVSFADPGHDFPQRLVYERLSPRSILAWIEGDVDGVSRVVEFPMVAVSCP